MKKNILPLILIIVFIAGIAFAKLLPKKKTTEKAAEKAKQAGKAQKSQPEKDYQEWLQIINKKEPGLCQSDSSQKLVTQYETETGWLTKILCQTFAYQESYVVIYSDAQGENQQILSFTEYMNANQSYENNAPIDPQYYPQDNKFIIFTKGRGVGDCGSIGEYTWNDTNQTAELVEFQIQECDQPLQSPWPTVYP